MGECPLDWEPKLTRVNWETSQAQYSIHYAIALPPHPQCESFIVCMWCNEVGLHSIRAPADSVWSASYETVRMVGGQSISAIYIFALHPLKIGQIFTLIYWLVIQGHSLGYIQYTNNIKHHCSPGTSICHEKGITRDTWPTYSGLV